MPGGKHNADEIPTRGALSRDRDRQLFGRFLPVGKGKYRPILLKKSAMVSTAEKYALEIEIFTLCRGFRTQISRSCAQKRRFPQPECGQSGRTDFFNTIGQKQSVNALQK
ncbi:hypothetical protein [Pseudomonas sp. GM78]|uniref:hypothetical protein n=1 Tax=Pseudomonas sp. GM78 TaxID=1144337 RepID=UPI001EE652FE|nr:hypothetical protein [Pseudomonas sp. GM78]